MPARVDVSSDRGVVIVRDESFPLPGAAALAAFVGALETEARRGRLFFLVTDDPVRYRIDIYAGESLPAAVERGFEDLTGSFLLRSRLRRGPATSQGGNNEPTTEMGVFQRPATGCRRA